MKIHLLAFASLIGCCLAAEITVDPAGAALTPGPGITITGDNAWTTAAATWTGTEWDTGTSLQSWTGTNTTASVSVGLLNGTSSTADPQLRRTGITGGPDLDLGWNDFIDIRIKLPLNYAGNIEIYYGFTATTDAFASQTGFSGTRMVTIPNSVIAKDNGFHVYRIDMGLEPLWRGKLSDLRIDPATISGTAFSLDYVRIGDVPGNDYTARVSDNCPAHGTVKVLDDRTHIIRSMESKRFRIIYSNLTLTEDSRAPWSDAKSRGTLRNLEEIWQVYVKRYGYKEPCYPMGAATGPTKFKTNMTMIFLGGTWAGGDYDSAHGGSFGWQNTYPAATRVDEPSWVNAHEFMHICQFHQGGNFGGAAMGKWFEAHADYGQEAVLGAYPEIFGTVSGLNEQYMSYRFLYATNPLSHYRVWPVFFYLDQNPDGFVTNSKPAIKPSARLWQESLPNEYIYATIDRINKADGGTGVKDIVGGLARREAIYDYGTRKAAMQAAAASWNPDLKKLREYSALVRRADDPSWWQIPAEIAPQAFAYTIHDLVPSTLNTAGRVVSVNFRGLPNPARQADWRASLVVVNDSGNARYSPLWNDGVNSVTLAANENRVYLSVAATPGEINSPVFEDTNQPYKNDPAKTRFPYEVQITGASVRETGGGSTAGLVQHANGGGWKASTATVANTAYIGPNARVLDTANVSGNARIEDFAVVKGSAKIQENAIVSGHAIVSGKVTVRGFAKIREYASVSSADWQTGVTIEGYARIGGRRNVIDDFTASENATLKGAGYAYQDYSARGDVIIDGDGLGNANLSSGAHTGWLWDDQVPARAATMPALNRLFASYEFPSEHPHSAIDQYGVTDATLVGPPVWFASDGTRSGVMSFNGSGQRALLSRWLNDFREFTVAAQVKWSGTGAANQPVFHFGDGTVNNRMFLTPSNASGVCALQIHSGGNSHTISAPSALSANTWNHVGVTLDGTTARLYLNGALVGSTSCPVRPENLLSADTNETPAHNFIAAGTSLPDFQGSIDDFKVYSTALPGLTGVTVSPLITSLSEMGSPLGFTFSRNVADHSQLATPLVVNFTVTGTATPGVDFIGLSASGSVTIPAGQTSVSVSITPFPDSVAEGDELFSVNVIPGADYGVTNGPAVITLQDPTPLANDLLAWYKLNETAGAIAADSSTNGNNGTVNGSAVWNVGELALTFDGIDDSVQTPVPAASSRTLAAWIRPHNAAANTSDANVFNAHIAGEWGTGWGVRNNQIFVVLDDQTYDSGVAISNNVWQHVALAFDRSSARIYVNGQLKNTRAYTQGGVITATYRIGHSSNNDFTNVYFDGDIRDAKIYGRAVNDLEILEIKQGALPAPTLAPSSFTATPVNGSVTLSWQPANNGEAWYTVLRSTVIGGPYTPVSGALTGTTFTDTTATPGIPYYYVVIAVNSSGAGPASTEASATAIAPSDGTWLNAASGNWSNPANWLASLVANGADRIATFSPASAVEVTQDLAGLALGGLAFNTANTSIAGSPITLDVATGTPAVQVAAGSVATLSNTLQGNDGLNKTGPGTMKISGLNEIGKFTVSEGRLILENTGISGMANGGLLNNSQTEMAVTSGNSITFGQAIQGNGTLTKSGPGTLTLSVANGYTGTTSVSGGTLIAANSLAPASPLSVASDAIFQANVNNIWGGTSAKIGPWTIAGTFRTNGTTFAETMPSSVRLDGGTLTSTGDYAAYGNFLNGGGATVQANGTGNSISARIGMFSNITFETPNAGDALTVSGVLGATQTGGNNGGLIKSGSGTLTLSAVNSYTGGTTVDGGTLSVSGASGNGRIRGALTVNANGTVVTTGDGTGLGYNNQLTQITVNGGLLKTSGSDCHIWNITSGVTMTGGELQSNGGVSSTTGNSFQWNRTALTTNASANPALISGRINLRSDSGYTACNVNVADGAAAHDLVISAAMTGTGVNLVKAGQGTLVLSGINTYTGGTSVNAGNLAVTGSLAASSAVSIGGASATGTPTLTGTGTVNGSVTINAASNGAAGTLNPGAVGATGQLSTGPTTINGTLAIDLDAENADKLVVIGNLNIAAATINFNPISTPTATSYGLVSYTGSLNATAFATVNNLPPGYQLQFDGSNKLIQLVKNLSAYDSWAITTHGLSGADAVFDADPDGDGIRNGLEWILGGNPNSNSPSISPTATFDASDNLVITFKRLEASINEATLKLEYGTDLITWPGQIAIGSTSTGPDANGVSVSINTTASPDAVTVTIPASNATSGRIFTRLNARK